MLIPKPIGPINPTPVITTSKAPVPADMPSAGLGLGICHPRNVPKKLSYRFVLPAKIMVFVDIKRKKSRLFQRLKLLIILCKKIDFNSCAVSKILVMLQIKIIKILLL